MQSDNTQATGRLRQAGPCTIFTTKGDLEAIMHNPHNACACEMAQIILNNREAASLQDAIYEVMDTAAAGAPIDMGKPEPSMAQFRFDIFQQFCFGLQRAVSELQKDGTCSFCRILGNSAQGHVNKDCPACKLLCNRCFRPGHNRQGCSMEACKIPSGFCVMCLMPVDAVYGVHSGRYGKECHNEMRDCLKPLVTLLFWSKQHAVINEVAHMLWSETLSSKPATFHEYWEWLWSDSNDRVYGILKVLNAVIQCMYRRSV